MKRNLKVAAVVLLTTLVSACGSGKVENPDEVIKQIQACDSIGLKTYLYVSTDNTIMFNGCGL